MKNTVHILDTPHLILRSLEVEDAVKVQVFLSVNKQYMLPWIPWAKNEPESVEVKKKKILEWQEEHKKNIKYIYGVFEKGNGHLIGMTFLFTRRGKGTLEIGYILDFREYGKGYATEASRALTELGFDLGAQIMLIYCDENNIASSKIPKKLGYENNKTEIEKDENGVKKLLIWEKTRKSTNQT